MKIGITGSRKFTDKSKVFDAIKAAGATHIITGGATGPDTWAETFARQNNIPCQIILPKFKTDRNIPYHPRWFLERNKQIVDQCDILLAFWDGASKGTKHTLDYAKKTGRQIKII